MNTEKTLKNSVVSTAAYVLNLLLQFIGRRIFVIFLDIEYLGYQSLFGNIFSLLSIAELGVGGIISFHLYKEVVEDNRQEIGKLMCLYKWVYRLVAVFVLTAGIICIPLLPAVVKEQPADWNYLYVVYAIQLGTTVFGYLLSYRRTIYIVNQKEYRCIQIDLFSELIISIFQITVLVLFRNFILYLVVYMAGKLFANALIAYRSNKDYPYLRKRYKVSKEDIQKRNFVRDLKDYMFQKVALMIYSGTDSIIISMFCGVRNVALYGNYFLLRTGVTRIFYYRLLNPVQATIGNIIYGNRTKEELWDQFQTLDVFSCFFASYLGIGFLLFLQPTIQIWMGKEYLFPMSYALFFSLTIYLESSYEIIYKYRSVFGEYFRDRNCAILSAALNIIISLLCVQRWGVTGVQIGTLIAFIPILYGRARFVVCYYFKRSLCRFICRRSLIFVAAVAQGAICWFLARGLSVSLSGLLTRAVIWLMIPFILNCMIFCRDPHLKAMFSYFKRFFLISVGKIKHCLSKKANQ